MFFVDERNRDCNGSQRFMQKQKTSPTRVINLHLDASKPCEKMPSDFNQAKRANKTRGSQADAKTSPWQRNNIIMFAGDSED
jgi:hypothetical protein